MRKASKPKIRKFISLVVVFLFMSVGITTASAARAQAAYVPATGSQSTNVQNYAQTAASPSTGTVSPVDAATGLISNSYWHIVPSSTSSATANAANITAALNWASANGIRTVYLKTGTYYVNGVNSRGSAEPSDKGIFVPSNMTFNLNGSTLIQTTNGSQFYSMVNIIKASNVTVTNGFLVGDRQTHDYKSVSGSHEFGYGVDIRGSSNVTISNLSISQMTGDAVIITGVDYYLSDGGKVCGKVSVTNCKLTYCRRQGISVVGANGVTISGNTISNISGTSPQSGIDLEAELDWPVSNVVISGNTISNTADASIIFSKNSTNCKATGNTLNGFVDLTYGNGNVVSNNAITNGGVRMTDTCEVYKTTISGNTLKNSYINCTNNQGTAITNNKVTNGYVIFAYCSGEVTGNTVANAGSQMDYGILIYADEECGADAIYNVRMASNSVSGNYASKTLISSFRGLKISSL